MQLELWELIGGILIAVVGSGGATAFITSYINRKKTARETEAQTIKNLKDENDIDSLLQEKAQRAVKEQFERERENSQLRNQLAVEKEMRITQGDTLIKLAKDIGESQGREQSCQEQLREVKKEIAVMREQMEIRDSERHRENLMLLGEIKNLFQKCVVMPKEEAA